MIFVTVSGMSLPFWRLIKKMDEIAGRIDEEVLIQGGAEYNAVNARYVKYLRREEASDTIRDARLVIAHAGAGTLIKAIAFNTPIVIVPRLKKLKEHHSDHQLELAEKLEGREGIKVVYDVDELEASLDFSIAPKKSHETNGMIEAISSYINGLK